MLWMSLAVASAEEGDDPTARGGPCYPYPSAGYRRTIGYGEGRETRAIQEAKENARQQLLDQMTEGFSAVRRDAVAAHIGSAGAHYANRKACAAADIEQRWIESLDVDAAQYERDVAALAAAAGERIGDGLLQLEPPTWVDSGCVADIGATLMTALRGELGKQGLQLVAREHHHPTAPTLRLELAAEAKGVRLSPMLLDRQRGIETPLEGFRFPLDLFSTTADEAGSCTSDTRLGLQHGRRSGTVHISLEMPSQDGFSCEGATVEPILRSQTPVHVQVFSVYGDEALAVWGGPVDGDVSLGSMTMLRLSDADEKLVVVAAKDRTAMGVMGSYPPFCRVEGGLQPEMYPLDSTVESATVRIWPAGTRGCAPLPDLEDAVQAARDSLARVPPCP